MPDSKLTRLEDKIPWDVKQDTLLGGNYIDIANIFSSLFYNEQTLPPWWSVSRDVALRKFWKTDDHIAGAVYAMQAKMTAIPFKILPINTHIKLHQQQAQEFEHRLQTNSELLQGWDEAYGKFIIDLHTQDNGAFMLIMKDDPYTDTLNKAIHKANEVVIGSPMGVIHLDSARCMRTGDPMFPVLYTDDDGVIYKLHRSRVILVSQMPSPNKEMNGVGICAVSRSLQAVKRMVAVSGYLEEKLGSRPPRAILTLEGLTKDETDKAFMGAIREMDNEGYGFFSKLIILSSMESIDAKLVDLSSLPDGFNEEDITKLAMYAVALGFGVDARELWPATEAGATKADATVQHQKARGKAPGHIMRLVEHQINLKFLPRHLIFEFDYQDDEQDKQRAEIRKLQSETMKINLESGALDHRATRVELTRTGAITKDEFDRLELSDGRLPDGNSVLALFFSNLNIMRFYLDLGLEDPLNVEANDVDIVISAIQTQEKIINKVLVNASNPKIKREAQQALAALKALRFHYAPEQMTPLQPPDKAQVLGETTVSNLDNSTNDIQDMNENDNLNIEDQKE